MAGTDDILQLLRDQAEKWKARDRELDSEIHRLSDEQTSIRRKLEAAAVLIGDEPKQPEAPKAETPKPASNTTAPAEPVTDAIVRIAGLYKEAGALPGELKGSLHSSGYDMSKFSANPGYFYTVLGRLVNRGKLERRRNGAYRVPQQPSSPQGETGAVGAPVSH